MQKIMQGFSIVRPFEEEKILTDDLKLKYSLFLEDKFYNYIFIPYSIDFIAIGGDIANNSKFGYSAYALMIKEFYIGNLGFKFTKEQLKSWENAIYRYYPITNCGEVEIRYDFDPPGLYYQLFYDMQWRDEWHR